KTPAGLEEVADGELEVDLLLEEVRVAREGDAPLEAQRPEGRDPADAEAPARADVEGVERAGIVRAQASLRGGRVAERRVEVPGVAAVGEDDTADADLLDDRELDLHVVEELHVPADRDAALPRDRVRIEILRDAEARAELVQREA